MSNRSRHCSAPVMRPRDSRTRWKVLYDLMAASEGLILPSPVTENFPGGHAEALLVSGARSGTCGVGGRRS